MRWANMIIFFIILALFVAKPYLGTNFPYTHDGENHLARFANYKLALKEGQFPPRFAPNLLNHYGYPVFNYNYPLANVLSLPFSVLKVNYEITFKVLVFSFLIFGFIGINKWLLSLNFSLKSRLIAIVALAFSPYLANIIYYRGNIGELMALMIFPWLLYFIEQPTTKNLTKSNWSLLGQVAIWTMFFLSHNVMVLFGTPILITYALFKHRQHIFDQLRLIFSFGAGTLLSMWFWLPAIFEKDLVILENADLSNGYLNHFPTLNQLLFSPLRFGFSMPGSVDTMSFQLGGIFIFTLIIITIAISVAKTNKIKFFIFLTWLFALLQLPATKNIWELIPLANYIQFPWRLAFFFSIFSLPLVAWLFENFNKKIKFTIVALTFIQILNVINLKPADYFHRDLLTYDLYPATTSTANENLPIDFTFEYFADSNWEQQPTILDGQGNFAPINWSGSKRNYQLSLSKDSLISEPTANFAGWQTFANGTQVEYINSASIGGRIAYKLPAGEYQINSRFTQETQPRQAGNTISLITLIALIGLTTFTKINEYKRRL